MTAAHALLLLDAQRYRHEQLEQQNPRAADFQRAAWRNALLKARQRGVLVVFLQRDGEPGDDHEPLTRGWTLHPDFRVEESDVLLRVQGNDAFRESPLRLELRSRGIGQLSLLALPGSPAVSATRQGAQHAGFVVTTWRPEETI